MIIENINNLPAPSLSAPRYIISGGGTGGHIYPALAIAQQIKAVQPNAQILFVGAKDRMEMEKVPAAGFDIIGLRVQGFDRKRLWRNIAVLWHLWRSMRLCRKVLKKWQPDCVIGVGGYASGAVLKQAQKMGFPTVIQEQNSYPGVTNKLLAPKARKICVAYEGTERFFPAEKIVLTGNPIREAVANISLTPAEAKRKLGFPADLPMVLVTGGSLGARTINLAMQAALPELAKVNASVLWQTGKFFTHDPAVAIPENVHVTRFIDDMAVAYRAADLVVARAGACTISELQLLGKAAILVPSPNVAEDHQRKNAEALSTRDAAVMVLDKDAPYQLLDKMLTLLNDSTQRKSLSENVRAMALNHSAEKIVKQIMDSI